MICHVYGGAPSTAVKVVEYASPALASGIVVEATDTDFGATTTRAVAVPCTGGDDESRTATRMVNVPDDCG